MEALKISMADVFSGRAYIRIPPEGKVKLAHMAGAPFSDKNPDAELSDLQRQILDRSERVLIVHGGSGLGKSVMGGVMGICSLIVPNRRSIVIADRYDHVRHEFKYIVDGMKHLFRGIPQALPVARCVSRGSYHQYSVQTAWGAACEGKSISDDDGAALLGAEFDDIILGEASHIPHDVYERRIARASDRALTGRLARGIHEFGRVFMFTTPKEFSGTSAMEWQRVMDQTNRQPELLHCGATPWENTVWIREASVLENPDYSHEVYEQRKATLTKEAFEETYLGKMTFRSGRVIPEFGEEHIIPADAMPPIKEMRLGVGIDTGAHFGAVLYGIYPDPDAPLGWRALGLGEVYLQGAPISTCCAHVQDLVTRKLAVLGSTDWEILKKRIEVWRVDVASQHKADIIEHLGVPLGAQKIEVLPSLDQWRDWVKNGAYGISEEMTVCADMIRRYTWKRKVGSKLTGQSDISEPVKVHDHLLDATRICLVPLTRLGPPDKAPEPVTLQEAVEQANRERFFGPLREQLEKAAREEPYV